MILLKEEQIEFIRSDMERRGLLYPPLREEIVDHVCNAIESQLESGVPFMDAYKQVLAGFGPQGLSALNNQTIKAIGTKSMLKSYLIIALRNLRHRRLHTSINLFGLVAGLTSFMLILLLVSHEWSYDRYHEKANRIFRLTTQLSTPDENMHAAYSLVALQEMLPGLFPEVENTVRMLPYQGKLTVNHKGKLFNEEKFYFADSAVFGVFTYPMVLGNASTALALPNSLVLTESTAIKYFGKDWKSKEVLSSILQLNEESYQISGVMKDIPSHSDMRFDALLSGNPQVFNDWAFTFVLLRKGEEATSFAQKLPAFIQNELLPMFGESSQSTKVSLFVEPLTDVHFSSGKLYDTPKGNRTYLYVFMGAAILLLLLVCANYINMTLAQATNRLKEVGIRKTVGAQRIHILMQFTCESALLCFGALLLAYGFTMLLLPFFNGVIGKEFTASDLLSPSILVILLTLFVILSLLSGAYPALYLSSFKAAGVLKGKIVSHGKPRLQRALTVLQFTTCLLMLISTLVLLRQMRYLQTYDTGLTSEQVLIVDIPQEKFSQAKLEVLRKEITSISGASQVGVGGYGSSPGEDVNKDAFYLQQAGASNMYILANIVVDEGYLNVMDIGLVAGRNFDAGIVSDTREAFIVNESFVKSMGWGQAPQKALGAKINSPSYGREGEVVGVVADFHLSSLHNKVEPLVLMYEKGAGTKLFVRAEAGKVKSTLANVQRQWETLLASEPFSFHFLDSAFEAYYEGEKRLMRIFGYASLLTITIALLGLFGLVSFTMLRRRKEIGIRKVLGASKREVTYLLIREFVWMVLLSFVVASPLAYYLMSRWLENFAYHNGIGYGVIALSGLLVVVITLLTVGYHALQASRTNPAESLRVE
jgi:putative ABC transport system permease protein